ncbi:MAG: ABC transporter ATP-binding protein [Thermodesulfobacteriota bacterium]
MSGDTIIRVAGLSKKFRRYASVAEGIKEALHPLRKRYHREFWALRDVSFEVRRGESVGIVGRNGSGKSTLLQVICGILQPTTGSVEVAGKVAALLELGAGFHPEFTGRENVFLQGAIMGFTKEETEARFEEVASFADIGDFIDQPVRTYSSGMLVRLAFASAINVDPDILVVDEALGVGDEAFQRKCYGRIHTIQEKGGTIIFVSHSAGTVIELCDRALLLDGGELLMNDRPKAVVSRYHKLLYAPPERAESIRGEIRSLSAARAGTSTEAGPDDGAETGGPPEGDGAEYDPNLLPQSTVWYESRGAAIENPRITTPEGRVVNVLVRGEEYVYTYDVRFTEPAYNVVFGMLIKSTSGFSLGGMLSHPRAEAIDLVENGKVLCPRFRFRCIFLPGVYFLNAGVLGIKNGSETFLHRGVDVGMFRVKPEVGLLQTELVDISSETNGTEVVFRNAWNHDGTA